jgi:hypothetical protein
MKRIKGRAFRRNLWCNGKMILREGKWDEDEEK